MTRPTRRFIDDGYTPCGVYATEEISRLKAEFDRIIVQLQEGAEPCLGPNAAEDNGIILTLNVQKCSAIWLTEGLLHQG